MSESSYMRTVLSYLWLTFRVYLLIAAVGASAMLLVISIVHFPYSGAGFVAGAALAWTVKSKWVQRLIDYLRDSLHGMQTFPH